MSITARSVLCTAAAVALATALASSFWNPGLLAEGAFPAPAKEGVSRVSSFQESALKPAPDLAGIAYGPHERNVLDFWKARSRGPAPLFLYIHGGGFRSGDKSSLRPTLLAAALEEGFAVAAINYRLSDQASFPAFMQDAGRAVQFLRWKAREWNLQPEKVVAAGGSAGGGLALWLALHDDLAEPESTDPVARQSTRLAGAGGWNTQSSYDPRFYRKIGLAAAADHPALPPFYGLTEEQYRTLRDSSTFQEASSLSHVSADDPPIFLFYAQSSEPLPENATPNQAVHHPRLGEVLKEKLDSLGVPCELHSGVADRIEEMDWRMIRFFKKQVSEMRGPASRRRPDPPMSAERGWAEASQSAMSAPGSHGRLRASPPPLSLLDLRRRRVHNATGRVAWRPLFGPARLPVSARFGPEDSP